MFLLSFLSIFGLLFCGVEAQCWRDTTCAPRTASFTGPWEGYIHAPSTRVVSPITILNSNKEVLSTYPGTASLKTNGSLLIFDFGQEVGGIVTIGYSASGSANLGLAFSEARNWTGTVSDGSNGFLTPGGDGAIFTPITATTGANYTMPDAKLRGGFRYLSVFAYMNTAADIEITSVTLELSFQPNWADLRAYGGYFYSNDELVNRIWYAGAYTLQTNAVPGNTGRVFPLQTGWQNNASLGTNGSSIFVDGSKRDRTVWAGDLAIALPSVFVSTGDFESARNAIEVQYELQKTTGELPFAGPPLSIFGSDTYHMSTLIGTYEYVLHSGDMTFLTSNWAKITLAINYIAAKIDSTGMLDVTATEDWGRHGQGGHNTEANALLYRTLVTGSTMANWTNNASLGTKWTSQAETLKTAVMKNNWDPVVGAFKDNDNINSIHPEDGNSLALAYSMADASTYQNISNQLITNWGPIGAICPELPNNIVPYVEGMEIKGHLAARQATRALALMRLSWGWYLNSPYGTNSTIIEGYLADGTFGYRAGNDGYGADVSYTSHAHGWSTGPTHALSTYVLGLQLLSPGGATWMLAPQFGDLASVEGGFTTPLGTFSAKWAVGSQGYNLSYEVPSNTTGTLVLPAASSPTVTVDGEVFTNGVWNSSEGVVTIGNQAGGTHTVNMVVATTTQAGSASQSVTKKSGGVVTEVPSIYFLFAILLSLGFWWC